MQPLRWPNEVVRHKVLDLIGDFALLGAWPQCEVIAIKSGHALHAQATRDYTRTCPASDGTRWLNIDIREIMEILPHRYPMLLIDRILELETDERARAAYKNITANEPMFTGHFPGNPVFPGVYMIEAMAQLGGATCARAGRVGAQDAVSGRHRQSASSAVRSFRATVSRWKSRLMRHKRNIGWVARRSDRRRAVRLFGRADVFDRRRSAQLRLDAPVLHA